MNTNQLSTQRRQAAKSQRKSLARKTFASLRLCGFALNPIRKIKYTRGTNLEGSPSDVLIRSDLREFLVSRHAADQITDGRQPMNTFQPFGKTRKTNVTKPVQFSAKAMS